MIVYLLFTLLINRSNQTDMKDNVVPSSLSSNFLLEDLVLVIAFHG